MLIWWLFSVPMHDFHLLILKGVGVAGVHAAMWSWLLCISELYPWCYLPFPSIRVFSSDFYLFQKSQVGGGKNWSCRFPWKTWFMSWCLVVMSVQPWAYPACEYVPVLLDGSYRAGLALAATAVRVMRAWVGQEWNCFHLGICTCSTDTICWYQLDL